LRHTVIVLPIGGKKIFFRNADFHLGKTLPRGGGGGRPGQRKVTIKLRAGPYPGRNYHCFKAKNQENLRTSHSLGIIEKSQSSAKKTSSEGTSWSLLRERKHRTGGKWDCPGGLRMVPSSSKIVLKGYSARGESHRETAR